MDQSSSFFALPRATRNAGPARRPRKPDGKPDRVHHSYDWRLDFAISGDYAGHYTAAKDFTATATDKIPAHARLVRVFLRLPAFLHMDRARQILRLDGNVERRAEAALHHGGLHGFRAHDSPGHHLDRRLDPTPGREALAIAASRDLFQRDRGRDSLLLAGEVGRSQATAICSDGRRTAGVAAGLVDLWSRAARCC